MYLIYIDESGDTGLKSAGSPTDAFVLSAVVIKDVDWLDTLNQLLAFRRFLYQRFNIRQRDELKSTHFIHNNGPFESLRLGDDARMSIYRMALRFQRKVRTITTWAVLIDKARFEAKNWNVSIRDAAWGNMIERIERFTNANGMPCMIFPDDGNNAYIQGLIREKRRFSRPRSSYDKGATLARPATLILEDPCFRRSGDSYFIQLADYNAYAAYRHIFPQWYCGAEFWDELGDIREERVNSLSGGPKGLVVRPKIETPHMGGERESYLLGIKASFRPQGNLTKQMS